MPSGWTRARALIGELACLPQSMRGGPGYQGPVSEHFDGARFFNPGATAGRSFSDFLRWQRTRRPTPWPRSRELPVPEPVTAALASDELRLTFINHVTFLIQLPGLTVLTDPVFSERASPVQWAGPRRVHAPGVAMDRLPGIDTGYSPWFAEIRSRYGSPTVALLPIGAYEPRWFMSDQHMNPDDAVRAHRDLEPGLSLAMHFGCFRLTDEGIDEPARALEQARAVHGVPAEAFRLPVPGETIRMRATLPAELCSL